MTTPIRPVPAPQLPVSPQPSQQALAAQRAFFQAAMDRAAAPSNPAPTAQVQQAAPPAASRAATDASPEPMPRLGRYLDIRV